MTIMIKRLLPYIGRYKKYALLAPLFVTIETIAELILPLLMANIIDKGIILGNMTAVLQNGALMLVVAIISMIAGTLSAKNAARASEGFGADLRKSLFDQVQEFSFADIDRFSSASLITRMTNDVTNLKNMVAMGLRPLVRAPVMMIAALGISFYLNARLACIILITIPILALCVGGLMKVCHHLFDIMQKKIDALNETVQENLVAIRVVKSFVRGGYERTKFKTANDEFTTAGLNAVMRIIFMQPIMMMGMTAATLLVLWFGGQMVLDGTLLVGNLSSLLSYIFQILFSVLMVAQALLMATRAQACAQRVIEVLDAESDIRDGSTSGHSLPAPKGKVEFRDVSFRYKATGTGEDVLHDINLTIQPGQFVAVVGGTGEGKSSLVNLIPRFYDTIKGQVLVDGEDVKNYPLEQLRRRIGMVLQNNVLFSGTIRENLLWGAPEQTEADRAEMADRGLSWDQLLEERMIQAARDAQAYDFVMSFPEGFDTYLDQGGVNVSGGQKQRLCIARAMLKHPAILILDDSTSAVDSTTEGLIRDSFQKNMKDTTVIIIAQRISSVQTCDQIVVLDNGTIAGIGSHAELMASNHIYQEIYNSQQEGVSE